jgi:hypothetical protein
VTSCCWISTKPGIGYIEYPALVPSTSRSKIRPGRNFCLSESDSADVIVARIETVKTSSED